MAKRVNVKIDMPAVSQESRRAAEKILDAVFQCDGEDDLKQEAKRISRLEPNEREAKILNLLAALREFLSDAQLLSDEHLRVAAILDDAEKQWRAVAENLKVESVSFERPADGDVRRN